MNPKFGRIYKNFEPVVIDDLTEKNKQICIGNKIIILLTIIVLILITYLVSITLQYNSTGKKVKETKDSIFVEKTNPITRSVVTVRYPQKAATWYVTDTAYMHTDFFTKEKFLHFEGRPVDTNRNDTKIIHAGMKNRKTIPKRNEKVRITNYEWPKSISVI